VCTARDQALAGARFTLDQDWLGQRREQPQLLEQARHDRRYGHDPTQFDLVHDRASGY